MKESDAAMKPVEPGGPCQSVRQSVSQLVRKKWTRMGESTSAGEGSVWEWLRTPMRPVGWKERARFGIDSLSENCE